MPPRRPPRPTRATYSESAGRYRDASGRFLSRAQVRDYLDGAVESASRRLVGLADQLAARTITLAEWQTQTRLALRDVHAYSAAVAQGGLQQMTPREWGHVGATLRGEYQRLNALAEGIASGRVPLDGRFRQRMRLYGLSGRATHEAAALRDLRARGYDEERNVRYKGDSCAGCVSASAAGWVAIGTLALPGTRDCLGNCRCKLRRRNSVTGKVAA